MAEKYKTEYVDEIPYDMDSKTIYVSEKLSHVGIKCPCQCQAWVILPVNDNKGWNMKDENGDITLSPSILQLECKSHFFFTENKIKWC